LEILRSLEVKVDLQALLRQQGCNVQQSGLNSRLKSRYEEAIAQAYDLLEPAAVFDVFEVQDAQPDSLRLTNDLALESELVTTQLAQARRIALAVCTIAPRLEQEASRSFAEGHSLQGLLYDNIGSVAIGHTAAAVALRIEEVAVAGGEIASFSIAPGSADCILSDQRVIFGLLPAERIGVRLNSAGCMFPTKSISLVIGLGSNMPSVMDVSQCDFCPKRATCPTQSLRDPHVFRDASIASSANQRKEETLSPHTASSPASKQPKNLIR